MNLTCNSTLEDMRIRPGDEKLIAGPLTFHDLAIVIAGGSTVVAVSLSFYLVFMHATHYTKPREQRQIIRILFMIPVYAASSWLQLWYYWHAVYFQVMSDCYEAFAIASFFSLMCHYLSPDLHTQKEYFRNLHPIKPWVWPLTWFAKCCGGERGPWRTPKSGLTWFNINWIGIYHYVFIRVAMTITAVVSQYFHRYCESSNNPVFAHIWVISINCVAVTIAMYCVIQFYVQLREALAPHSPFLKVLAIKLVVFFSFWQVTCISLATSTLDLVHPNEYLAYPDIKVGIPALLLCFEMALFAILHIWAFPWKPYAPGAKPTYYPNPDARDFNAPLRENEHAPPSGGWLGLRAVGDALNLWDFVKAFGRGMRWLFCGVKRRKEDPSYKTANSLDMDDLDKEGGFRHPGAKSTEHLPIAHEFRRSTYLHPSRPPPRPARADNESDSLIAHAQPHASEMSPPRRPERPLSPLSPTSPYHDKHFEATGLAPAYHPAIDNHTNVAPAYHPALDHHNHVAPAYHPALDDNYRNDAEWARAPAAPSPVATGPRDLTQQRVGDALWGPRSPVPESPILPHATHPPPGYSNNHGSAPGGAPGQAF
ncbi:Transmembrane protein 184-like protein [Colletotrichum spinosum]|uniref:Transmembrane protein 184-like protein n=1 Tax=Colletotrichum spinosum TaxID=1347390 RepID=A0A4R8Q4K6_9PEZI|nr:Transmembrane protein 184-like protein [Colletotrichum spinosum]